MRDLLYKRYQDPLQLLSSYKLGKAVDFLLWLINERNEEELFDLWKHSQSELGYIEWKKKNMKATAEEVRVSKRKQIDPEKEKESIEYASKLLGKALGKGGGE